VQSELDIDRQIMYFKIHRTIILFYNVGCGQTGPETKRLE